MIARRTGAPFHRLLPGLYQYLCRCGPSGPAVWRALAEPDVIGLSVGTRPDWCPTAVLDLLHALPRRGTRGVAGTRPAVGVRRTLEQVNRGHDFAEYVATVRAARARGLKVCTHLIIGLPGKDQRMRRPHWRACSEHGVDGLRIAPATRRQRHHARQPVAARRVPTVGTGRVPRHRCQPGRANPTRGGLPPASPVRLRRRSSFAPDWCRCKWRVIDGIAATLQQRGSCQGSALSHQRLVKGH